MTQFSEKTAKHLKQAGWTPGAVVHTTTFEELLSGAGFVVNEAALSFLGEYGGLRIEYPHAKVSDLKDEMHFDPAIVVTHIRPSDVKAYGRIIGRELCPIGEAARGYLVLMMDQSAAVYAVYDESFFKVGNSGSEAIEALCSGKELEPIPVPDDWWSSNEKVDPPLK